VDPGQYLEDLLSDYSRTSFVWMQRVPEVLVPPLARFKVELERQHGNRRSTPSATVRPSSENWRRRVAKSQRAAVPAQDFRKPRLAGRRVNGSRGGAKTRQNPGFQPRHRRRIALPAVFSADPSRDSFSSTDVRRAVCMPTVFLPPRPHFDAGDRGH